MKWLRRNCVALALIVVSAGLIAGTVTYPTWADHLGRTRPEITAAARQPAHLGDVQWRLREVTVPDVRGPDAPPGSRFVAFVVEREIAGAPAPLPKEFNFCFASLHSGDRSWSSQSLPARVRSWAQEQGYVTRCDQPGTWFVGMSIPDGAELDALDVHLRKRDPPPEHPGALFDDIRFDLG